MRFLLFVPLFAACTPQPMDPARAADQCEQRARAAQGPTGNVTLGVNNRTGGTFGAAIGITDDFVRGRDPIAVYEACVFQKTGQNPVRAVNLR